VIDVVCASKHLVRPKGLEYLPDSYRLFLSDAPGWGRCANELLDKTENDVLFIDDDVELLPGTFDLLAPYYDDAEMFGLSLIGACGTDADGNIIEWVQSSGQMITPKNDGVQFRGLDGMVRTLTIPCYIAHVGTCCAYIKKEVIAAGVRFPLWEDGIHQEDTVFCLQAWLKGFRCLRLPSVGFHHGAVNGAGAIKGRDPNFQEKRLINMRRLEAWVKENGVIEACVDGRIPMHVKFVSRKGKAAQIL
jgi:GT2 family glycosyltransferase